MMWLSTSAFAQLDPLLQNSSAVTLGYVYRHSRLKAFANLLLFGDPVRHHQRAQLRTHAAEFVDPHARFALDSGHDALCSGNQVLMFFE